MSLSLVTPEVAVAGAIGAVLLLHAIAVSFILGYLIGRLPRKE